ncbi:hypothetical protein IW261DRAFT_1424951 [Armillaria novae-zelandiae]|uniref:Uncharacterized protein n=1 Tax=Armillaria novae-zelandiae TaxID=153914 RepID=A0AA39NTR7_9AGAR|nr:hypothetical protein IW261DRAFT_1424951 [Armillaria novae-zelandiae]
MGHTYNSSFTGSPSSIKSHLLSISLYDETPDKVILPQIPQSVHQGIDDAVEHLAESALSTLVNTFSLPGNSPQTRQQIPPQQKPSIPTLDFVPSTEQECTLATIIQRLEMENELLRRRAIELQAANVLNEAYCAVLREQLAFKEEKGKKKTASGRLMGDEIKRIEERWEKAKEEWNEEKEKWKRDKTAGLNVPACFAKLKPKRGPLPKAIPRPTIKRQSPTANKPSSESPEQFDGYSSSNGDSADAGR